MPKAEEIAHRKAHYANYSDEQLIAEKHQWVENSEMHIAAVQILDERQKAKEAANHAQLLIEIKRPHWSVTPGFVVGVIAMVAACIAAYPVLFPAQERKSSPPTQQTQNAVAKSQPLSAPLPTKPQASNKK